MCCKWSSFLCSRKMIFGRLDLLWRCVGRLTRPERNLRNLYLDRALKSINCNNRNIIEIEFLKNKNLKSILFPYYMCCELRVICLENEHPWWNAILWTTSLLSTWPKFYSKISLLKVTILMFSQELIWRRENLLYKYRGFWTYFEDKNEDTLLEKWCIISLPFHSVTLAVGSQAFRLSSRTFDERFRKMVILVCWLTLHYTLLLLTHFRKTKYSDWLRSIFYCYLLTFRKLTRCQ